MAAVACLNIPGVREWTECMLFITPFVVTQLSQDSLYWKSKIYIIFILTMYFMKAHSVPVISPQTKEALNKNNSK